MGTYVIILKKPDRVLVISANSSREALDKVEKNWYGGALDSDFEVLVATGVDYGEDGNKDKTFCDHCGEDLDENRVSYSHLPFDVSLANKGESAVLCEGCNERLTTELTVCCVRCGKDIPADEAHLHQGDYIGECCWDERLRATE
jgi:hypothetical protein